MTVEGMQLSDLQEAILNAVIETDANLIIQAAAGSGKTTTLKIICQILPPEKRVLAACFNRSIALEFQKKLPPHVEAKTLHSVGRSICMASVPDAEMDERKVQRILDDLVDGLVIGNEYVERKMKADVPRLISLAMATLADLGRDSNIDELECMYDLEIHPAMRPHVNELIRRVRAEKRRISFDDMLDAPLFHNYHFPRYDYVLVDEAQDLNAQQLEFVSRLAHNGRIIAVGDRNQAIYAFRGADSAAMDRIQQHFNCIELPLSYCYRCGASIIREAQAVVGEDQIQSPPGAHLGDVVHRKEEELAQTMQMLSDGDLVLCRVNAPLVSPAFDMIAEGRKAIIKGRDIGKGLQQLLRKHAKDFADHQLNGALTAVSRWAEKRITRLLTKDQSAAATAIQDQVDTLEALAQGVDTISALDRRIQEVFAEDTAGVTFSSIHRAKGLEADRVVYLGPHLVPHPMAKGGESLQQEYNLDYVARTRAKHLLIYQPLAKKKKNGEKDENPTN